MVIINKIPKIDDIEINGVVLNDRDFHCIARLFQSAFFAPKQNYFYGCMYCKYAYECQLDPKGKKIDISDLNMIRLCRKFGKITGVDNGPLVHKKQFYSMSIQELYPEKYKKICEALSPKDLKKLKKTEEKFARSFKIKKWRLKLCKKEGIFKYDIVRKTFNRFDRIYSYIHNKLVIIKWKLEQYFSR